MLSKFFIERPIFATVLAIMVMAFGIFSILNLPVERYPDIAPPRIYCILVQPAIHPVVAESTSVLISVLILIQHRYRYKIVLMVC